MVVFLLFYYNGKLFSYLYYFLLGDTNLFLIKVDYNILFLFSFFKFSNPFIVIFLFPSMFNYSRFINDFMPSSAISSLSYKFLIP